MYGDIMKAENILKEYIDENVSVRDWNEIAKSKLNLQLAGRYDYQIVTLLGEEFLLAALKTEDTLPVLLHDEERIETASEKPVAFYFDHISSFRKKNLLKNQIAFMDSDEEIYLPFMALRLKIREQRQNIRQQYEHGLHFAPGAQLVFLYLLYRPVQEYTMSQIAGELGISIMTAQRSLQTLYDRGLVKFNIAGKTGREKRYTRIDQVLYYQKGKYFLANPVIREIFVNKIPDEVKYLKSDLTALAEQTMLGEPEQETVAVPVAEGKQLERYLITEKDEFAEFKCIKVQIMDYNILKLSNTGYVDPITLILSLSERDERIDQAVDELMEGMNWYQE